MVSKMADRNVPRSGLPDVVCLSPASKLCLHTLGTSGKVVPRRCIQDGRISGPVWLRDLFVPLADHDGHATGSGCRCAALHANALSSGDRFLPPDRSIGVLGPGVDSLGSVLQCATDKAEGSLRGWFGGCVRNADPEPPRQR